MLALQEYLLAGNTPESLASRGIYCYRHPDNANMKLVGFKYDQIESSKSDPIGQECRGVVLEDGSWKVVAKAFNRFFNLGEFPELMDKFDWKDFTCTTKEDGSLILLYHYAGEWRVNTSGSFGLGMVNNIDKTWKELFLETAAANGIRWSELNTNFTYVFELCTGYNKVVRRYPSASVFLLSVFDPRDNCYEMGEEQIDTWADVIGIRRPVRYSIANREELAELLDRMSMADPSFEGFVIRDRNGNRWKAKTMTYCALHHMKDNGNIIIPDRLTEICLKGEKDEVKAIMPEISTALDEVDLALRCEYDDLLFRWNEAKDIENQKDFAMKVKDHRFSGLLFAARKSGEPLNKLWRKNPQAVADKLFGKKTFQFDIVPNE